MILGPTEIDVVRRVLLRGVVDMAAADVAAARALLARIEREHVVRGARVFSLELGIGSEATKQVKKWVAARREFRKKLGVKRLKKGEGPAISVLVWAPTLNEYNGLDSRQKEQLRKAIDARIVETREGWPDWHAGFREGASVARGKVRVAREGGRRRAVVVTRYSSRRVDEVSVDVCGGKMPIDRLVLAGVLRGDTDEWLVREAAWVPVAPGHGKVVVDVYEIGG